jgi:signal transduction histidine kinase
VKFPLILADQAKCATALKNVIENSLKYSEGQKKAVEIELSEDASSVRIHVRDHGIGIPHEERDRVFEPFYRVDKSRTRKTGGYGLGLSLAREIMRAHGGDILIESRPRWGTRVSLVFPKAH